MKKILVQALFFLFILGINTAAKADGMRYGPQIVEDATVPAPGTLEINGIYSSASNDIEVGPAPGVTIVKPLGPSGEVPPDPDPIKVSNTVSGFTGILDYGLGHGFGLGVTVPYVNQKSGDTTYIPTASGLSDTTVKAKVGSGYVSAALSVILPTGVSALSMKDNGTDYAVNLALSPFGPEPRGGLSSHLKK